MFQNYLLNEFPKEHLLDQMARYHIATGGKCLRGRIALAEAKELGIDSDKALKWGLACELLHNATLIHDDIQDHDPIRRGKLSLWKKFGISQAINAGDLFIFRAFKLAAELNTPLLSNQLAQISEQLVYGQSSELETLSFDKDEGYWPAYLKMAQLKTGALFQLPALGIHILKQHELNPQALQVWLRLGVCYQIFDDIRDYLGLKQEGQKQKDFTEQRTNAIIAYISREAQYSQLVKNYQNTSLNPISKQNIILQINNLVDEKNLISRLQDYALNELSEFKKESFPETRKIVLGFFDQAMKIGETKYVSSPQP